MESTYCYVTILSIISALWLIGYTQANFNMLTSKKYDHHFFGIYYTAFKKHLKEMNENQFWEAELRKYAKKVDTGGIIKKWTNFWDWKDEKFKYLRQHFFFAVRLINDNSIPAPLLILMHLKYQAFLHAIVYMNGAILLPENDERRIYCRTIATDLLNFSDIGTRSIIKYLEIVLRMFCGQTNKCTDKIKDTLGMWVMAVYSMWNKFGLQMISDSSSKNSSNDMAQLYQKLCDEQNEIMLETKIAMMSLFEGIKQSVDKPYLPPKERLTLHYDAAVSLWDKSKVMWAEHLQISKAFWSIGHTQANFNMIISKKYDHHFFNLYHTAFENHLNEVASKNQFWEAELLKYAEKMEIDGIVKKWSSFKGWENEKLKYLRQHFLFAVRSINDSSDPAPLLILMHVKYQAFLHAIPYMNGAILLPEKDEKRIYCRAIANDLLHFSDVGTTGVIKKLEEVLKMSCGQTNKCSIKIIETLTIWTKAVYKMWNMFVPQMISDDLSKNLPNDIVQLYQKLCNDQDEIMLETKISMMSLFEGIKQSVDKPHLPPKERLKLHFAAAIHLWDNSKVVWIENFQISKSKYQIMEVMMQYDMTEMRFYGELRANSMQEIEIDDLKDFYVFDFRDETGIIELIKPPEETGMTEKGKMNEKDIEIFDLENTDDELSEERKRHM